MTCKQAGGMAALLMMFTTTMAVAQVPDVLVSLSTGDELGAIEVRNEDVVRHAASGASGIVLPSETWAQLVAGVAGEPAPPGNIDALHDAGSGGTVAEGLYFSMVSSELGFLDGDVLRASNDGVQVFLSEAQVQLALGVDGDLDVDAFHLDPDGTVLLSLAETETSTFLSGDDAGTIKDGAILHIAPGAAQATILYTESQVTALVNNALGNTSASGDTKSLSRDPASGAVLFSVQSPSSDDGTVFSDAAGGSVLGDHAEADFGFTGSGELDALSIARSDHPVIRVGSPAPAPGADLDVFLSRAEAGQPYLVLGALNGTATPLWMSEGWGGLVLAQDVLLLATLSSAPYLVIWPDLSGAGTLTTTLPAALMPQDIVIQVLRPGAHPVSSNPVALELGQ